MVFSHDRAHGAFERQVLRSPQAVAVVQGAQRTTYGELDHGANRLAHHLRARGVGADALVAVCMARSSALIESFLAVLKAGGAYVPLDPAYPVERLAFMLADARPAVVLTDAASRDVLARVLDTIAASGGAASAPDVVEVDTDAARWASQPVHAPVLDDAGPASESLAYVIYTSGSTGRPKGVLVPHRGLPNLQRVQGELFAVGPDSRVLQFASPSFDACTFEWSMALSHGASLHLGASGEVLAGETLAALIARDGITHATLPPVVLSGLPDGALDSLQYLICAGEALPPAAVRRWGVGRRMFNAYGPTETTIWSSVHACDPQSQAATVPIGRAIAGHRIRLLDDRGGTVKVGDVGEIHIGGVGVARGYLHRPELTAERFIDSPFGDGDRLYRTGDLARELPDGTLEYLGRNDFQVKIRGHRIELGEIEVLLAARDDIEDAVVLARSDAQGRKQLVAYYRHRDGAAPCAVDALRETLAEQLPAFMLPSAYVRMDAWPVSPNGKLDRNALPEPQAEAFAARAFVAPASATEIALAAIWSELLAVAQVGLDDAFLALGGDSLKTIQLAPRIRDSIGRRVAVPALFRATTLREMAALVDASDAVSPDESAAAEGASFDDWDPAADACGRDPLSLQQHGLWLLEKLSVTSLAYNAQNVIRVRGRLDPDLLQRAVDTVIARHEIFRTTFHVGDDGEPYQCVHPRADGVLRREVLPAGTDDAALTARIDAHVAHHFDLETLPLVHLSLIERNAEESVLIHVEQHYVHDGWSANLFLRELLAAYGALANGGTPALPPVPAQYRHYARWQRSADAERRYAAHVDYWKQQLAGAPTSLPMRTDFPRPSVPSYRGDQVRIELPPAQAERLRHFAELEGATLYAVLQAVFQIVIRAHAGCDDFLIGSAVANRRGRKAEGMLGMFVNTIAVRSGVAGDPTYRELLARTMETLAAAYEHEEVPFEHVVRALQPERMVGRNPLFQVAFSAHNSDLPSLRGPGFELSLYEAYSNRTSKFDFDAVMIPRGSEHPDGITIFWEYSVDLYRRETIERLSRGFLQALATCVERPELRLSQIDLMSAEERARSIEGGYRALPAGPSRFMHAGFERHAAAAPETAALVREGAVRRYAELNAASNRLARHLRECGAAPETRVVLWQRKSFGLIESILAVLKAGAAYVPLDTAYPQERLAHVLADAAPVVIVTDGSHRATLEAALAHVARDGQRPRVIDIDADAATWASLPATDLAPDDIGLRPEHLAYVIYTSGSTGMPKGVMVEHRQIMAIRDAWEAQYALRPGLKHLQMASPAFDVFTADLLRALDFGGTLVLCPPEVVLDSAALLRTMRDQRVDFADFVPAVLDALISHLCETGGDLSFMDTILCGSDVWSPDAAYRARRHCGDKVRLFNAFGMTEAAVDSTCFELVDIPATLPARMPIGTALPNVRVLLLDEARNPVPVGVAGELYIGGAGVARGYLNREALSAERFIDSPFAPGERLYRSGDLARIASDGQLEYLGRNDFQVKIRGYRIEPGEIESKLVTLPGVRDAVVIAWRNDDRTQTRLVAYYRCASPGLATAESLRGGLARLLPDYMVPSAFVELEEWPLTTNGKLDRKALPVPDLDSARMAYVAPSTPMEVALAAIWSKVLGLERVGVRDNFFELGGHSLLAAQLAMAAQDAFGVDVTLRDLFEGPTIERMLETIFARIEEDETDSA